MMLLMVFAVSGCTNVAPNEIHEASSSKSSKDNEDVSSDGSEETEATGKILVAYFSCTGTTEALAEITSEILSADLYEIVPTTAYTTADLNYGDSSSRATKEQNDPNARPEISGTVASMDEYDTIALAYPLWWEQAPKIISTFLESYDLGGKTVLPFCTPHSSGVGSSADNLHSLASDTTTWIEGQRFGADTSREEIKDWLVEVGVASK